jgi:hypothetical protein
MSGLFSPDVWADGEEPENAPNADDLNREWHDSWDFFLNSRPMALLHHTTASVTIPNGSLVIIPMDTEVLKRGGMVHSNSTNNSRLTVPYTGQYSGYAQLGFGTVSTLTSKFQIIIRKNGTTQIARPASMAPVLLGGSEFSGNFTLDLTANDYIEFLAQGNGSTAPSNTGGLNRCKLALWYVGDFQ